MVMVDCAIAHCGRSLI